MLEDVGPVAEIFGERARLQLFALAYSEIGIARSRPEIDATVQLTHFNEEVFGGPAISDKAMVGNDQTVIHG